MSLSEKAREDALHVRQQYISRLEEVFYSRQCLNLQAVKVLLPQDVGESLPGASNDALTFGCCSCGTFDEKREVWQYF